MRQHHRFIAFLAVLLMASVSSAATTTFPNGETVTYTGTATPSTSGSDLILKFTSGTGTLTLTKSYSARILVVGGGGAGGGDCGGGGGAGGLIQLDNLTIPSGTYNVTVGAGGTVNGNKQRGNNGGDSRLTINGTTYTAVGGGAGGIWNNGNGSSGGSGGGSVSGTSGKATQSTPGVGHDGGTGNNDNIGGGGGGAGSAGYNYSGSIGGKGGDGIVSDITGTKLVYAAGGGGGDCATQRGGAGGGATVDDATVSNVGGHGGSVNLQQLTIDGVIVKVNPGYGFPGKDGTGSGGGGSCGNTGGGLGGVGGSGVVIVRLTPMDPVCQIGSTKYTTLEAAIAAASGGNTIELLRDITISSDVTVNKNVTITSTSGNNFKITRNANCALYVTANVTMTNVTVDGGQNWNNSTISTTTNGTNAPRGKSLIFVENGAQLTLNSGATVQNLWGRKMDANDSDEYAGIHNAGTLVINDGAVLQGLRHRASDMNYYAQQKGGAIFSTGTVVMNGGTIQNCYSVGRGGAIYAAAGTVELKGGTITNCAAAQGGGAVYLAQGRPYTFFRFAITKVQGNNGMQLSELSLKDANGNRVNQGTYSESTGDWSALGVRQYKVTVTGTYGNNGETPDKLFDGNTNTKLYEQNSKFTFGFRIPDGSDTVAGYTFTTANDSTPTRNPLSWTVEGSVDGQNWVVLDQRSDVTNMPQNNFTESPLYALQTPAVVPGAVLKVSGNPTVSNNNKIADGQTTKTLNNVQPTSDDQIELAGVFTGSVGVSYPASEPDGAQFGVMDSGSGADKFFYDGLTELTGAVANGTLVWGEPVCRIGDVTYVSLSAALSAAADNDTIVLLKDIVLNKSLSFDKPVTLTSEEGSTFTITRDSSNTDKTLTIGSEVVFENITFDGGSTTGSRLISVAANGELTLGDGAKIQHVYCSGAQAIQLNDDSAVLNIEQGATISDCKGAATTGGAIRVNSGTLNMVGGTITGCANTNGDGGAIYVNEDTAVVNVMGGTITNCSASGAGGAITANRGTVNIYGGVITGNTAGTNGGAVQYGTNGGILAGGTIKNNTAGTTAGGVYVKGPVQVYGSPKVVDNTVNGAANNLVPTSATQIQLKGTMTGRVGVSYPATGAEGAQFGAFKSGTGANNFVYDGGTYAGQISNGTLVWSASATPGPMPEDDDPDTPADPVDPMYYIDSPQTRTVDLDEFQATGAEVKRVGDDVVLIYTNLTGGTLTIPDYAHARVMAVGGGAAGGTVGIGTEKGAGGGGGAGGMSEMTTTLMPGTYQIQVGAGAVRVDSYVQSWVGNNGGFSALVNPQGIYVTSVKGGGGGGAPKVNGVGAEGGSGGGGSWWGTFLDGGSYTDGYGWYGAKPSNENIGGGGGGAATNVAEGAGKADGTAGAGRASDITGETVVYAVGGRGGDRTDLDYVPADGVTPGSGGDGAGDVGAGGAGADGVVVVRLIDFFNMVKVPYPSYTENYNWADGDTLTAFDVTRLPESYQNAIASIQGTTQVVCSVSTVDGQTVTNGLGRQSFTIALKDGYVWDDGTDKGFDAPKTFFWRVREENVVGNAMAEVTKTVEWSQKTNAVIAITAHTTPEKRKELPKVLFLGTLCSSHSLDKAKLADALTAAAANASQVDYYLSANMRSGNPSGPAERQTGTLYHGGTITESGITASMGGAQHPCLVTFYDRLYTVSQEKPDFYDYIIIEFDGTRLAHGYGGSYGEVCPHEAEVAEFLIPYYRNNKVILVVDNDYAGLNQNSSYTGDAMEPWSQEYWRPNTYMYSAGSKNLGFTELKGLIGLFYPEDYQYYAGNTEFSQVSAPYIESKTFKPLDVDSQTYYAGRRYGIQTTYEDGDQLAEYIRNMIQAIDYTVNLTDNICLAKGLKLNQVSGCWTTNETVSGALVLEGGELPEGWYPLVQDENLFPSDEGVQIKLPTISTEAWIKLWLDVSDTGRFLSSIDATYNAQTGLWQKDPNNGPVVVSTTPDGGEAIIAEDQAATDVQWSFDAYELTGMVMSNTNGLFTGDILVNGYSTNWVAVGENSSPQVVFRGAPGYILDRLVIDGKDVDFDLATSDWLFEHINSDHDVKVWYKPYAVADPPPPVTGPVTNVYDGTAYCPTVTNVTFTEDIPYEWYPVYSLTPDGEFTPDGGQTDVVWGEDGTPQPTDVYVRIAVKQPGYEEPVVLDSWTGVNTVTILPREISIQYEDYAQSGNTHKETDFDWHLVESLNVTNQLVEGDYVTETGSSCSNYPEKGEHTKGSISNDPSNVVVHNPDGTVNENYIVHVLPGDYYIPDKQLVAEAEGVEKIYDGKPETIDVTVLNPTKDVPTQDDLKDIYGYPVGTDSNPYKYIQNIQSDGPVIKYSNDGGKTYTLDEPPMFTNAGTNTVYYKVDYQFTFEHRQSSWNGNGDLAVWKSETVVFTNCTGSADVIIHPRTVTVTADSAEKFYDGQPLTDGGYTVAEPTATTGFVEGEGATFQMTSGSTITNPGTKSNVIDPTKTQATGETKLTNYEFCYETGTLTVKDKLLSTPTSIEKTYDGEASTIGVEVTRDSGLPISSDDYTIKYSQYPDDPNSWTNDLSFVNVGVSNEVWYVVEATGYDPVTNKAYVTIWPREIVVTADDKEKIFGTPDPELTWTISDGTNGLGQTVGVLPSEVELVAAAVASDPRHDISRDQAGTPEGEQKTPEGEPGYPITVVGSEYIGNYHVTYVQGELRIVPAIFSSNIYGLLKINSTFANTIIPAPWKGYTQKGSPELDIRVDRLVKPRNLTEGDRLLYMAGDGTYKTWVLEMDETTGEGRWTGLVTAKMAASQPDPDDVIRSLTVAPAGDETLKRGYGLWLIRQKPVTVTNGGATTNAVPFYLHGQWMTGVEEIEVFGTDSSTQGIKYNGAVYDKAAYTMLADPDCTRPSVINNHTWNGWGGDDTLIVNTDEITTYFCLHRPKRGGGYQEWWRYWAGTDYATDAQTTPGIGFWYVRRSSGNLKLKWDGEPQYLGEAQPHSVWIVDHADAGDGKVHLAFKLESPIAPAKLTTTFIQELFASHSIRYMHTTGTTQAAGKAAMDALDPEKESDVKLVPALRNGTGVATDDPTTDPDLAKGWIWVTIDVPDGSTAADPAKDGTGDTNGAGDLWRIVIGRGMWE